MFPRLRDHRWIANEQQCVLPNWPVHARWSSILAHRRLTANGLHRPFGASCEIGGGKIATPARQASLIACRYRRWLYNDQIAVRMKGAVIRAWTFHRAQDARLVNPDVIKRGR
jgi:hypothetical protein